MSLVKACALYGDESVLFSPTYAGTEPLLDFSTRPLLHQLVYLALLMGDPGFVVGEKLTKKQRAERIKAAESRKKAFLSKALRVSEILHEPCKNDTAEKELQEIIRGIRPLCEKIDNIWSDSKDFVKRAREIAMANKLGLVTIANVHNTPSIYYSETKLKTDVGRELSQADSYGAVDERFFAGSTLSNSVSDKLRFSSVAATIFDKLPAFSAATIDEISDIRNALTPYLSRFRKAIIDMSLDIKSAPWDKDFPHDVDKELHLRLYPALSEIQEQIETNSYLKEIVYRAAKNPLIIPSSSAFGLIISNATQTPALIGQIASMVAGAGLLAFEAHKECKASRRKAETNAFFFYYKASNLLKKTL